MRELPSTGLPISYVLIVMTSSGRRARLSIGLTVRNVDLGADCRLHIDAWSRVPPLGRELLRFSGECMEWLCSPPRLAAKSRIAHGISGALRAAQTATLTAHPLIHACGAL